MNYGGLRSIQDVLEEKGSCGERGESAGGLAMLAKLV